MSALTAEDATEWLLLANAPPPTDASLKETVQAYETKRYEERQFANIQGQTLMDGRTLQFAPAYEDGYTSNTQAASLQRIRAVFLCGFVVYTGLLAHECSVAGVPSSRVVWALDCCVALPAFIVGFGLTYVHYLNLERITCGVFFIVATVLIVKKPLLTTPGPVLPLMLLLIPIFGITRMRFVSSCALGTAILLLYMTVQLFAAVYVAGADPGREVMYQVFNYAIRVFGGMVSHYRQEVLRRRNYALQLPFAGLMGDDECVASPAAFSKRSLLRPWSLSFREAAIEAGFVRYWYLLDPLPFENIHDPALHRGVFATVRYALVSAVLAQVLLALQDAKLLPATVQAAAAVARFGVVVPAYGLLAAAIFVLSRSFAARAAGPSVSLDSFLAQRVVDALVLNDRGGYVRSVQLLAGAAVLLHVAAMGVLVLVVHDHAPAWTDLYLMGLLNALLFVHRSGFRVRFLVATTTTGLAGGVFIGASWSMLAPPEWRAYAFYTGAVLVLGGLISHEEESLRRSFFILRALRTVQFRHWLSSVVKVQSWMRAKLRSRLRRLRAAKAADPRLLPDAASTRLAQATKVGVYGQLVQVIAEVL
ncbi:hypothetical protein ACHHYP_09070 [Achlya hypogyna]|uniref:Transmembrane protein n=1 Tax=Achlya hypogyna TaxID=1202772 RepID=A0A1V9ZK29_ACHHY|nr:hypothetical protein ACHHYP_09070 [Achlya hypogyna]